MSRFSLNVEWLPEPAENAAFGPERFTWGRLEIRIDGEPVTSNHPVEGWGPELPGVVGGMAGLADWIAGNWLALRFESHTPFAKVPPLESRRGSRFPSLRDAVDGWAEFVAENDALTGGELGDWQQRHTLGAAHSDLAIPSVVIVPDGAWTGIGLDHLPPSLSPTVRFTAPGDPGSWPATPVWLPSTDVADELAGFVARVVARAREFPQAAPWASWMEQRWNECRRLEVDEATVRRWSLGEVAASAWAQATTRLRERSVVLEGLLADSDCVRDRVVFDELVALVDERAGARERPGLNLPAIDWALPPWREGYRLAQDARTRLDLGTGPLDDRAFRGVLRRLDIEDSKVPARGLFRSACWSTEGGAALVWAGDDPRLSLRAPRRFAVAAALGRLLSAPADVRLLGMAHGAQARYRPAQLANAFAAEFLLPIQAIQSARGGSASLAERFGLSKSATEWHVRNRALQTEG